MLACLLVSGLFSGMAWPENALFAAFATFGRTGANMTQNCLRGRRLTANASDGIITPDDLLQRHSMAKRSRRCRIALISFSFSIRHRKTSLYLVLSCLLGGESGLRGEGR
jgi:hypothetical protein